MTKIDEHLNRFYELLAQIEQYLGEKLLLKDCNGQMKWSPQGIYFFFENGEMRKRNTSELRVVRVGTHGVSAGTNSTLWNRLRQHRGTSKGTGNHRGSIFRRHVGNALLTRDKCSIPTWGNQVQVDRVKEREHEKAVSAYIGSMPFLWLKVEGESSKESDRLLIERNSIALLSNQYNPVDLPTDNWLGTCSDKVEITKSGLWNYKHVKEIYDPSFLSVMQDYVTQMVKE